jgi:ribose-phosphate pyrophosphokinase
MGGSKRAYAYSKALESDVVICYKQRAKANIISHMELIGDVKGKNVVLVDDMVDTAGTLTKAADLMMERGAVSVRAITTHGLLSGEAYERIEKSKLQELIITDSIPSKKSEKIKTLSCAGLFADVMHRVHHNTSIASKFLM